MLWARARGEQVQWRAQGPGRRVRGAFASGDSVLKLSHDVSLQNTVYRCRGKTRQGAGGKCWTGTKLKVRTKGSRTQGGVHLAGDSLVGSLVMFQVIRKDAMSRQAGAQVTKFL